MKNRFTHLLLAVLLLCAQAFAAVHAIEHVVEEGRNSSLPSHACEICLAGHDLGAGLSGKLITPLLPAAVFVPHCYTCVDRAALPAPLARQQGPPDF